MTKAEKLRKLFEGKDLIRIAGAHNGLTAKLVEQAGFEGVWASSLEMSASRAVPDANILTMKDYFEMANNMNESVSIPVVVDVDTGYGNSTNVMHMVKKFESAGIAGIVMEDKLFPKQNSLLEGGRQELASIPEFVGKIMAAKNAQQNKDFMVFARIEALIAGWGHEEALRRARAYAEAGADGIFIHSKQKNPKEILDFIKAWDIKIPLILCPTSYKLMVSQIKKLKKVKMVIFANAGLRAAVQAEKEVLRKLNQTGDLKKVEKEIAPMAEIFELQGTSAMKEEEKKYLKKDREDIEAIVLAAGAPKSASLKKFLDSKTPLVMMSINGKSLLERNVETLKNAGIKNINVLVGHLAKKVRCPDVNKIYSCDYQNKYILHSIFSAEKHLGWRTLLIYGDIIFDNFLLEKLLKAKGDIVLAIDASYKNLPPRGKKLDLVRAKYQPIKGHRKIENLRSNPIIKIGQKLGSREANFEFIGLAKFSEKGSRDFKKFYYQAKEKYRGKKFHEAKTFETADMSDLLQEMINDGYKIDSMEVSSGWSEVHSFSDYKRVCEFLSERKND
jgi:phosphoenolpyruvate phosphomutase